MIVREGVIRMPLTMANTGKEVTVLAINSSHDVRMRLTNLGITPGISLRVISRNPSSMLIGVRDTRLMVNFGLAHQIQVQ
jgi:ferrous iron transport protein A